ERPAQPIDQADLLLVAARQALDRAPENRLGDREAGLLVERDPQLLRGLEPAFGRTERFLELRDRFVEQAHLLERDSEIVMGLKVLGIDVFLDAALELGERLVKRLVLVFDRRGLIDPNSGIAVLRLVENETPEIDERRRWRR